MENSQISPQIPQIITPPISSSGNPNSVSSFPAQPSILRAFPSTPNLSSQTYSSPSDPRSLASSIAATLPGSPNNSFPRLNATARADILRATRLRPDSLRKTHSVLPPVSVASSSNIDDDNPLSPVDSTALRVGYAAGSFLAGANFVENSEIDDAQRLSYVQVKSLVETAVSAEREASNLREKEIKAQDRALARKAMTI